MNFYRPTSIRQLTLITFLIVAIPVVSVLVGSVFQVDKLVTNMSSAVIDAAQSMQTSRGLVSQAFDLERSAAQYQVLQDSGVLQNYTNKRKRFLQTLADLSALDLEETSRYKLELLAESERQLFRTLNPSLEISAEDSLSELPAIVDLVQTIPFDITRIISGDVDKVSQRAAEVQQILLIQAAVLIPVVLVLAGLLSMLITRPLGQFSGIIQRLGAGDFSRSIRVEGPLDLRDLGKHLGWLQLRLNELEKRRIKFLQHVSHELKSPLAVLREGAELLNDEIIGSLNMDQTEIVQILRKNCLLLQNQIDNLLEYNRALAVGARANRCDVRVKPLIEEIAKNQQLTARARHVSIETDLSETVIFGNKEQLRVLLNNLLINAVRYSPTGGKITIRMDSTETGDVVIDIGDQGPGIALPDRPHVFEAFYRGAESSQKSIKGTGLGLAIALEYAKLHQGTIEILDAVEGALLRVALPRP